MYVRLTDEESKTLTVGKVKRLLELSELPDDAPFCIKTMNPRTLVISSLQLEDAFVISVQG